MDKLKNDIEEIIEYSLRDLSEELIDKISLRIKNDELYNVKSKDPFINCLNCNLAYAVKIFNKFDRDYAKFIFSNGIAITIDLSTYGYECIRDHTYWMTYFYDEREIENPLDSIIVSIKDHEIKNGCKETSPDFIISGASVGKESYTIHFSSCHQLRKELFFDIIFKEPYKNKKIYFKDYRDKPDFDEIMI